MFEQMFYSVLIPFVVFLFMCFRMTTGRDKSAPAVSRRGYALCYSPWILFFVPLVILITALIWGRGSSFYTFFMNYIFMMGITLLFYYLLLLLFRRIWKDAFFADTLVLLWLLPNVLYVRLMNYAYTPQPLFLIYIPKMWIRVTLILWGIGFVGVLGWHLKEHWTFKKEIFADAQVVGDQKAEDIRIREIWKREASLLNEYVEWDFYYNGKYDLTKIPIYRSPSIRTPLTIGLVYRQLRVVLPACEYKDEDLRWIFRHELVHIINKDTSNKLFLIVCSSLGWFIPIVWKLVQGFGEDMELSCDEKVLIGQDMEARTYYANLLLKTSGENRGITTCLSARGETMRYRLKHVVKGPKKKPIRNILLVTAFSLILTLSFGLVGYSSTRTSIADDLLDGNLEAYKMDAYYYKDVSASDFEDVSALNSDESDYDNHRDVKEDNSLSNSETWEEEEEYERLQTLEKRKVTLEADLVKAFLEDTKVYAVPVLHADVDAWTLPGKEAVTIYIDLQSEESTCYIQVKERNLSYYYMDSQTKSPHKGVRSGMYRLASNQEAYEVLGLE